MVEVAKHAERRERISISSKGPVMETRLDRVNYKTGEIVSSNYRTVTVTAGGVQESLQKAIGYLPEYDDFVITRVEITKLSDEYSCKLTARREEEAKAKPKIEV
jgi:hypothetical protein